MGRDEEGIVLLDLVITLPVIVLLMGTIAFLSSFAVREAYRFYTEAELRQEVQDVMMRITSDASEAYRIRWVQMGDGYALKIWKRPAQREDETISARQDTVGDAVYFEHQQGRRHKICYMTSNQPITGDSSLAIVDVESFKMRDLPDGTHQITLRAVNQRTNSSYELSVIVYVPREGEVSRDGADIGNTSTNGST